MADDAAGRHGGAVGPAAVEGRPFGEFIEGLASDARPARGAVAPVLVLVGDDERSLDAGVDHAPVGEDGAFRVSGLAVLDTFGGVLGADGERVREA